MSKKQAGPWPARGPSHRGLCVTHSVPRPSGVNRKGKTLQRSVQCPHQRGWAGPQTLRLHCCCPALRNWEKWTPTSPQTATGASSATTHSPERPLPPARAAVPFWLRDALWRSSLLWSEAARTPGPPAGPPLGGTCQHPALAMRPLAAGGTGGKGWCMKQWRSDWSADPAASAAPPSHGASCHSAAPAGILSPCRQGRGCVSRSQSFFRSPSHRLLPHHSLTRPGTRGHL